jgi:hypothetical protein
MPASGNEHRLLAALAKTDLELSKHKGAAKKRIETRLQTIKTRGDARAYASHVARRAKALRGA